MPDQTAIRRIGLAPDLIDSIYTEALLLADEARSWFDRHRSGQGISGCADDSDPLADWAARHDPSMRIALSCESLRLTTRLMQVIAWLLHQRAIACGEIEAVTGDPAGRLGPSPECDVANLDQLPVAVRALVEASLTLHARVAALEAVQLEAQVDGPGPVHAMIERLRTAVG